MYEFDSVTSSKIAVTIIGYDLVIAVITIELGIVIVPGRYVLALIHSPKKGEGITPSPKLTRHSLLP
jgi:hypothetical protein